MSLQPNLPFPLETNPECPEQCMLRAMSIAEREAWFQIHARHIMGGLWHIQLDGNEAATGYEDEVDDMVMRFHEYVDGPDVPRRKGGMG